MILLPMFGLAHGYSDRDVNLAFNILKFGVILFTIFQLLELDILADISLGAIVISIFLYLNTVNNTL